jgi:hypothetical protein
MFLTKRKKKPTSWIKNTLVFRTTRFGNALSAIFGQNFHWLMEIFSIKDVCSTSKNPQSDLICERMHQTVQNMLRTLVHTNPSQNMTQARDIIDDALATAMHAMQTTIATTLGSTPGILAFAQNMFLNIPLIADWQAIARTCEHHVNKKF